MKVSDEQMQLALSLMKKFAAAESARELAPTGRDARARARAEEQRAREVRACTLFELSVGFWRAVD